LSLKSESQLETVKVALTVTNGRYDIEQRLIQFKDCSVFIRTRHILDVVSDTKSRNFHSPLFKITL